MSLVPVVGGNLPIGFGVVLDNFSCELFHDKLADQHGTALAHHVNSYQVFMGFLSQKTTAIIYPF